MHVILIFNQKLDHLERINYHDQATLRSPQEFIPYTLVM